jgi:hypothetical protein
MMNQRTQRGNGCLCPSRCRLSCSCFGVCSAMSRLSLGIRNVLDVYEIIARESIYVYKHENLGRVIRTFDDAAGPMIFS